MEQYELTSDRVYLSRAAQYVAHANQVAAEAPEDRSASAVADLLTAMWAALIGLSDYPALAAQIALTLTNQTTPIYAYVKPEPF